MQKLISLTVLVIVLAGLAIGGAAAQSSQPSSKVTAAVSSVTILQPTEGETEWTTILSNTLKTANQKDLFVDVSLECGLYTDTLVKSGAQRIPPKPKRECMYRCWWTVSRCTRARWCSAAGRRR